MNDIPWATPQITAQLNKLHKLVLDIPHLSSYRDINIPADATDQALFGATIPKEIKKHRVVIIQESVRVLYLCDRSSSQYLLSKRFFV
jgi:hypothetical protein